MTSFLGIDIGTSAVKAVLVNERQHVAAESSISLKISRPRPLWSEQNPEAWWSAVQEAVAQLRKQASDTFAAVRAIGLSGQMHGAVLLGESDMPLRPAILWNDGRSFQEADELNAQYPDLSHQVGVIAMPGLTAPKLKWLASHEPGVFRSIRTILLPKDYIRLKLTGERATDMSDAAGTWWLDEASRSWCEKALAATNLKLAQMPRLVEGSTASGRLRREVAQEWGLSDAVIVAGGGGDAAAGAIGLGAVEEGSAFLSLGTSGQFFVATRDFRPAPETLVHAFCHAVPDRWFQMAAMLNGASGLSWITGLLGLDIPAALQKVEERFVRPAPSVFLPYLTGERTPHNDPHARGVFFGMSPQTDHVELVQCVMEGVAFSFADAKTCIERAGTSVQSVGIIGGGARSRLWMRILASVLDIPLTRYIGADKGPAFGAARLARLALEGEAIGAVCLPPVVQDVTEPEPALVEAYQPHIESFRRLYRALKSEFAAISQE